MHLWAGNGRVNSTEHNNYYYGYVDLTRNYVDPATDKGWTNLSNNYRGYSKTLGGDVLVFEPQDSDKGDIARAIFYMAARYNYLSGSDSDGVDANNPNLELSNTLDSWQKEGYQSTTTKTGKMGILSDLLEWNKLDPVDEFEIHRNNLLFNNYTNNRNPFIDFPEWADYIWGDQKGTASANPTTDEIGKAKEEKVIVKNGDKVITSSSVNVATNSSLELSVTADANTQVVWEIEDETVATIAKKVEATPASRIQPKAKVTLNVESGETVTIIPAKEGSTKLTIKATIDGNEETRELTVRVAKESNEENKLDTKLLIIGGAIALVLIIIVVIAIVLFMKFGSKKSKKKVAKIVKKTVKSTVKKSVKKSTSKKK